MLLLCETLIWLVQLQKWRKSMELSLCVIELVVVLRGRATVRSHFSVNGCRDAAAVLVVVGQRQVEQAGARG